MCVTAELQKQMKSVTTALEKYDKSYDKKFEILKNCLRCISSNEGNNNYSFLRLYVDDNKDLKKYMNENFDEIKICFKDCNLHYKLNSNIKIIMHMMNQLNIKYESKRRYKKIEGRDKLKSTQIYLFNMEL